MRITIERIRTVVLVAGVLLLAALGVFLVRAKWKNLLSRHDLPQRLAHGIVQEANGYTFVHTFGAHSQYRIHASKEVELKNDFVELHDVQIDLYGADGSLIDHIAGDTFEYDQKTGVATAQGPVEMLLTRPAASAQAAAEAAGKEKGHLIAEVGAETASAGQIDVKTSGVSFDRNSGLVTTGQRVNFTTAQGYGSAIGAKYDSEIGYLVLEQAVELTTTRGGDPVHIHAQNAEFDRGAQTCWLEKASAETRGEQANAARATILFRMDGSADRLEAMDGFTLQTATGGHLAAPMAQMDFDEHSQPRHGKMEGGVTMDSVKAGRAVHATSPTATLEFTEKGALKSAHLERGVAMESDETSQGSNGQGALRVSRTWKSPVVDIDFRLLQGTSKGRVEAETMRGSGGVVITSESRRGDSPATPSKLTADEATGIFGPDSDLRAMTGVGHAKIETATVAGARQSATGDRLQALFAEDRDQGTKGTRKQESRGAVASGAGENGRAGTRSAGKSGQSAGESGVQSAEVDGHVVLIDEPAPKAGTQPQPPLRATAGRAVYEGAGQWLHLTMNPRVVNGGLELTAEKVDVSQQSGDAFAQGDVKATWIDTGSTGLSGSASGEAGQSQLTLGGKGPAHVVSAEAQLNQSTGEATFRGHARLWQQTNFVSGPEIVLNQHKQTLVARSSNPAEPVRAVLLAASAPGASKSAGKVTNQTTGAKTSAPPVISVRGGDLWYSDAARRAVMHGGSLGTVVAETGAATSSSDSVELLLMPAGDRDSGAGAQAQVDRMTATGHVALTMQGLRATGEQLAYSSASGEYVVTGTAAAPPKLIDPQRGNVTGEALIFHSGDDSVSIEGGGHETTTETTAPDVHGK